MFDHDSLQEAADVGRHLVEHPSLDGVCRDGYAAVWTDDDKSKPPDERVTLRIIKIEGVDESPQGRRCVHGSEIKQVNADEIVTQQRSSTSQPSISD